MPTKTEARIVDILGWMWLATIILALVYGGAMSLAVVPRIGIAPAAAHLGSQHHPDTTMFNWNDR